MSTRMPLSITEIRAQAFLELIAKLRGLAAYYRGGAAGAADLDPVQKAICLQNARGVEEAIAIAESLLREEPCHD